MNHREEFWRNEADHWRTQYNALEARMRTLEAEARQACYRDVTSPEPPVGSWFADEAGLRIWTRWPASWYCSRPNCPNCPAQWDEVFDRLPAVRALHLPDAPGGDQ